jgi:U5 snRNP spliceosome subunit
MGADTVSDTNTIPPPPPGFTLDQNTDSGNVPPPPPGYTLDQNTGNQPQGKPQDWASKIYTPVIEGGAMMVGGAGAAALTAGNPIAAAAGGAAMYPPAKRFAASIDQMRGIDNPLNQPKSLSDQSKDVASDFGEGMQVEAGGQATGAVLNAATRAVSPYLAKAADSAAMRLGRRSLGFTKRFLGDEGNEINAESAVRTAYDKGIISPMADAEEMRRRTHVLQGSSGQQIGQILDEANTPPPQLAAQPKPKQIFALPSPKSTPPSIGPENVATTINVPSYGGSSNYEYKAAGEGPQYISNDGPLSHPVNRPEVFNKSALDDVRSGRQGSDIPTPTRVMTPPPREEWLFDPRSAIQDIQNLRPTTKSGQVLRGGDYDAQHAIIDNAINTIRAHGERPLSWDEANRLKGNLQGLVNYDSTKSSNVNSLKKKIASTFLRNLDSQLDTSLAAKGSSASIFKGAKKAYGDSDAILKGLQNKISSEKGNNAISLTDYLAGTIGGAAGSSAGPVGGAAGALGSMAAKKAVQRYGVNTAGSIFNNASKALNRAENIPLSGPTLDLGRAIAAFKKVGDLTKEKAKEYLRAANGDKSEARRLAAADGWSF